jgi:hypothetical protein
MGKSKRNSEFRQDIVHANKAVEQLSTTVEHLKSCRAVYAFTASVRTPDCIKTVTMHRPTKKEAIEALCDSYKEVTGTELEHPKDFIRYEDKEREIWANFEIYKPRM